MRKLSKKELTSSYSSTMSDMQQELTPGQRFASKLIHSPGLSHLGALLLHSLLRPLPLLIGAYSALLVAGAVLLALFTYHYEPSGFELIWGYVAGWIVGVIYNGFQLPFKR